MRSNDDIATTRRASPWNRPELPWRVLVMPPGEAYARQFGVLHGSMLGVPKLVAAAVWGRMLSVRPSSHAKQFNLIPSECVRKNLEMAIHPGMFIVLSTPKSTAPPFFCVAGQAQNLNCIGHPELPTIPSTLLGPLVCGGWHLPGSTIRILPPSVYFLYSCSKSLCSLPDSITHKALVFLGFSLAHPKKQVYYPSSERTPPSRRMVASPAAHINILYLPLPVVNCSDK